MFVDSFRNLSFFHQIPSVKYADDFNISNFVRNINDDNLKAEWNNVFDQSRGNCLPLNRSKCSLSVLNIITKRLSTKKLSDGCRLQNVSHVKILGTFFV